MADMITIQTTVGASMDDVWQAWNSAEGIRQWAFASDDWGAESKENDLRPGGRFSTRMFAKDSGQGFDFSGQYTEVDQPNRLAYTLDDGRKVEVDFSQTDDGVQITQRFEPEQQNDIEYQQAGWQAFLDNFKKYVEKLS